MTTYNIDINNPSSSTVPSTTAASTPSSPSSSTTAASTPSNPGSSTAPGTTPSNSTVPSTPSNSTVPAVQQITSDKPTEQTANSAAALPDRYLSEGFYVGEGKGRYVDPALVDHAEAIGAALAASGVKPAAFNRMIKTLKTAAKLPYSAQQGALKKLAPIVLDLEHKKKCPPMLRQMVERNQAAVQNEADFTACLDHLRDVAIYLTAAQS